MERTFEIILLTLPSLILIIGLFAGGYYYLQFQKKNAGQQQKAAHAASLLKIRLQAYERLVLFLERINPQQIVLRNNEAHISALDLQHNLSKNIREEYEHNLVQQIYISEKAWSGVVEARSWVSKLVNDAAASLPENASANDLAIVIVAAEMQAKENYLVKALAYLTHEARELL